MSANKIPSKSAKIGGKVSVGARATKIARAAGGGAKKAAIVARDGAQVGIAVSAEFAKKTATYLDVKAREALDKEFAKAEPAALEQLARLRAANPDATPGEIVALLDTEFNATASTKKASSTAFTTAATTYVLTLNAIHGDYVRNENRRWALVYLLLAADSNVARYGVQVGALVLSFASKRFAAVAGAIAVATNLLGKSKAKVAWLGPLAKLAGITKPGRIGGTRLVSMASRRILGDPPAAWPDSK
jgi:hypothetical protein